MKIDEVTLPPKSRKSRKRIGRGPGSGHGRYSCRGLKGQRSRSGSKKPPWFEGGQMPLQRRVPKRGFRNPFRIEYQVVNLSRLQVFQKGQPITPELLLEKRLIRKKGSPVKILGKGELSAPLHIRANAFSKTAKEKIESAGGKYEVI